MNKTNLIIAVKDADLRLSLDLLLREEPGLNVVGTATTTESMLGLIKAENPALVLLEWSLFGQFAGDVFKGMKTSNPNLLIVTLGNRMMQEQLARHFGADAFLLIGGEPEQIISTIAELISKESMVTK